MTPMTVIESPEFLRTAHAVMSIEERMNLVQFVGSYPETGAIIPGTGGVRKLRWGIGGRGKRGGARVIYYYHSESMPVILITLFRKNEKSDLRPPEKAALRQAVDEMVAGFIGKGAVRYAEQE